MSRPALQSLAMSYLRIGATAFGGGLAALPVFEAELAQRRGWLTPEEVGEAFAVSQSVPGVIMVNFAVVTAWKLSGKGGALLAAIMVSLPAFAVILALAAWAGEYAETGWVHRLLLGVRPAVVALIAAAAVRLARSGIRSAWGLALAAPAFVLIFSRLSGPIPVLLAGAGIGLAVQSVRKRRTEGSV